MESTTNSDQPIDGVHLDMHGGQPSNASSGRRLTATRDQLRDQLSDTASGNQPIARPSDAASHHDTHSEIVAQKAYTLALALSTVVVGYCKLQGKPSSHDKSAGLLKKIQKDLNSFNTCMNCELTEQGRSCLAALILTSPDIVKNFVDFADALFTGMSTFSPHKLNC